jgi:hypothetical protein
MNSITEIWKYKLSQNPAIDMPKGAKVLSVKSQYNQLCIWALVDPVAVKETRFFEVHGTGYRINSSPNLKYVGTALIENDSLVFHVFERIQELDLKLVPKTEGPWDPYAKVNPNPPFTSGT